ncbi:MAG: LytR C-terminal domain-containing protein [Actinomycetota bacterium]
MTGRMGQTRSSGGAAGRGLLLVLVALIIGVLLLSTVDDGDGGDTVAADDGTPVETTLPADGGDDGTTDTTVAGGDGSETTDSVVVEDGDGTTTETTVGGGQTDPGDIIEIREQAEVTVIVVNGNTGINGAAGRQNDAIAPFGYVQADPTNALGELGTVETSLIYYEAGYASEGQRLATELGWPVDETVVQPMPQPPPVESLAGANLLILLGTDRATAAG